MASETMMKIDPRELLRLIRMIGDDVVCVISSDDSMGPFHNLFEGVIEDHLRVPGNSVFGITNTGTIYSLDHPDAFKEGRGEISLRIAFSIPTSLVKREKFALTSAHSPLSQ